MKKSITATSIRHPKWTSWRWAVWR